jgi:hypothetical protein
VHIFQVSRRGSHKRCVVAKAPCKILVKKQAVRTSRERRANPAAPIWKRAQSTRAI